MRIRGYSSALASTPTPPTPPSPPPPPYGIMATSALDIIKGALRLLQVLGSDTILTAEEEVNGLEALNQMLDGWANEGLTIYEVIRESFALTDGLNPHTWGIGGVFNSQRPIQVLAGSINIGGTAAVDIPLGIVSYDVYESVRIKGLTANYPSICYVDNAYPLANVYFYTVPSSGSTVNFDSYKALPQISSPTDLIELPPGYLRALRFNLALELASEYQTTAGADVQRIALTSVAAIKRINYKPTMAKSDPVLVGIGRGGGRYNPYSDQRG